MSLAKTSREVIGPLGVGNPPEIWVECEAFTGSLATLFQCVRDSKLEVLDLPLLPVCEAYFRYVIDLSDDDIEGCSAALVALAYLLERKAFRLIPVAEDDNNFEWPDDDRGDFAATVGEYQEAIDVLGRWQEERERIFFRPALSEALYELPYEMKEVTGGDLARALERLLKRAVPEKPEILGKPRRSLAEQMEIVAEALPAEPTPLEDIVPSPYTRQEAVWWFLAILELIRLGRAAVTLSGEEVMFSRGERTNG